MAITEEAKARLKRHSADQLISKLRKNAFEGEERAEALNILRMRNKDISEFELGSTEPVEVEEKVEELTGEEVLEAIVEENKPEKNKALGILVETWKLPEDFEDYNKLNPEQIAQMKAVLDGTSELLKRGAKAPTKPKPEKKEKKKSLKKDGEKKERAPRQKGDMPKEGTKSADIYKRLIESTDSYYKIAQDFDTYYSVVKGIVDRYNVIRPDKGTTPEPTSAASEDAPE